MIDRAKNANRVLARKIAEAIKESGKSSTMIATEVGVSPQAVVGWKATGSIAKDTLVRFAHAVGKHPLHFMEIDENASGLDERTKHLSPKARQLIEEIIQAEELGKSSPQLIEALTKMLHVAMMSTGHAKK